MSDRHWTPFVINVVLHHYARPEKFERHHLPLYQETTDSLVRQGIMTPNEFGYFDLTPKGQHLVEAWCSTPAPVMKWVDPRFDAALKDTANGQ